MNDFGKLLNNRDIFVYCFPLTQPREVKRNPILRDGNAHKNISTPHSTDRNVPGPMRRGIAFPGQAKNLTFSVV